MIIDYLLLIIFRDSGGDIMNAIVQNALITLLAIWLLMTVPALGGQYEISWYTIDSGGGTSSGGSYVLSGTIGQADAAYSAGGQ